MHYKTLIVQNMYFTGLLLVDFFLYFILNWYFEKIIPQDQGSRQQPWYFLFSRHYWFPQYDNDDTQSSQPHMRNNSGSVEANENIEDLKDDTGLSVSIQGLRRVFKSSTNPGGHVAVDNLNLTMLQGQITALLGMLSSLYPNPAS